MARILYDAFYHQLPGHRIGENIVSGEYAVNTGRYAPDDSSHPNGLSVLVADLAPVHELRLLHAPYSDASLFDADLLLITNPDYPLYPGASPYRWTPEDVNALLRFMERGGGVLLLINSFLSRPDYWEENFDLERVSLLFDRLGVRWDANFMSDDKRTEPATAGDLCFGYGQGGRVLGLLPDVAEPLLTFNDNVYGFTMPVGAGRLAVIGDTGSISNGLYCNPDFENAIFFRRLIDRLQPPWVRGDATSWDYRSYRIVSAAPGKSGISEEAFNGLRPDATWTVDHHYRHLTWNQVEEQRCDSQIWERLPLGFANIPDQRSVMMPFTWVSLDGSDAAPTSEMEVTVQDSRGRDAIDLFLTGQAVSSTVTWADLCVNPEPLLPAGPLQRIHAVFQLRAILQPNGKPLCARWTLGQNLYARDPQSTRPGYARVTNCAGGVIVPRL